MHMKFRIPFLSRGRIYMDYASATPVLPEVARAVAEAERLIGNPGALHKEGVEAAEALEAARTALARELGCKSRELIFTSGGTEANNLAIIGYARKLMSVRRTLEGTHWIVASIEHPSVLGAFGEVERMGGTVLWLAPDEAGMYHSDAVAAALRKDTVCVSIGWANSEIGVVQPLSKIARVVREHERTHSTTVLFHSDAGQAPLYLSTTVHSLGVDVLSLDPGKFHGPRGIGILYIGKDVQLSSIVSGGSQERGLRPGTESVALISGAAVALSHAARAREAESRRVQKLRDTLLCELQSNIPALVVNGDIAHALPHLLNISIPGIQSEYVVLALDHAGIAISTKSACREGEERQSHVVEALGGDTWRAGTTLRFSLGSGTTSRDALRAARELSRIVHRRA